MLRNWIAVSVLLCVCVGCRRNDLEIEYFVVEALDQRHDFTAAERRVIEAVANRAVAQVRQHLPRLPAKLTLRVHAGTDVIPETGEGASAVPPQSVVWVVDPTRPGGVEGVANTWLRASLFHELHHLVRDVQVPRKTMLDIAVTEGLATAFERDYAGVTPPWGDYPAVVRPWIDELRANPDPDDRRRWLGRHPDGRRWVAFKTGTYLADCAFKAAGRSPADLVTTPTTEIVALALSAPACAR
jgi:hypothetical protein